jgi:hypothetical protein
MIMDWMDFELFKPPDAYRVLFYIKSKLASSPLSDSKIMVYGYRNDGICYYFGSVGWERIDTCLWDIPSWRPAPKFPEDGD